MPSSSKFTQTNTLNKQIFNSSQQVNTHHFAKPFCTQQVCFKINHSISHTLVTFSLRLIPHIYPFQAFCYRSRFLIVPCKTYCPYSNAFLHLANCHNSRGKKQISHKKCNSWSKHEALRHPITITIAHFLQWKYIYSAISYNPWSQTGNSEHQCRDLPLCQ